MTKRNALVGLLLVVLVVVGAQEVRKRVHVRAVLAWPVNYLEDLQYTPGWLGDGGPALELGLFNPMGIAEGPSGDLYISDRGRDRGGRLIWRLDDEGRAHLVAGVGKFGFAEPGEKATEAELSAPEGLAFDPEGRLHFVDTRSQRILRIEHDGTLAVVAGTGVKGYTGNGGPADQARLHNPTDVRIDDDGNIYIADVYNQMIRRVSPDGIIETVAGTGTPGYSGDGGPAREAELKEPWGVFIHPTTGRLLIADGANNRVREVDEDGIIRTVVGTGERGYSGDGGPALEARLDSPQSFGFDCAGRMYIGDEHNHVIRVVEADGTIRSLVGTGSPGRAPEGAVGQEAPLNDPENMHVACDGTVYIADGNNFRVIEVQPDGTVNRFAGKER
ncbi:MAG: hypothetical protein WD960_10740 [Gemmatimonadota bacterium]